MFRKPIHRCCLFYILLAYVRWKPCDAKLPSKGLDESFTLPSPAPHDRTLQRSPIAYSTEVPLAPPALIYSTNGADQSENGPAFPGRLDLRSKLARKRAQTKSPASTPANTGAPRVAANIPTVTNLRETSSPLPKHATKLESGEIPEITDKMQITRLPYNKILYTSHLEIVSSELTKTSLLPGATLSPNTNPKAARMLNSPKPFPPDIITTSPLSSAESTNVDLPIHATPVIEVSRVESSIIPGDGLESNASLERDGAAVPNYTRSVLQVNGTRSVKVEKRTSSHTMIIVPAVIGVISVLSIGVMAALYQWHQRGRRRKVYLSHPGAPPKDFAEDTGVRSPVLLPEEIEMQVGRSQSLRVRRAVILATDPPTTEADPMAVSTSPLTTDVSGDPATAASTPPPPPYREPPPYLPDMVIENIHAL